MPLIFPYSAQILLEKALFCRQNARLNNRLFCSARNSARRICLSLRLVSAVCPSNPIGSPGRRLEILNTEPSLIVNLKQPRKSQLFSVRLWSRSVICKVQCESNTRKLLLYHLSTWCLHVTWTKLNECDDLMFIRTLDIDAPWFWNSDIKVTVLFLFERRICSIGNVNFFSVICNCGFRYLGKLWCGIAVFSRYHVRYCGIRTPLTPPLEQPFIF